jgi:alcohol dehydrogenase class IV
MADPVTTLTASAIATLAFQKFIESGVGELAKKFSTEAIAKMDTLLKRIWSKLHGKHRAEEVKAVIEQSHKITPEQVNQIAAYLQVAMDEDPQFANDIRLLAQEINAGKLVDQSHMTQNIYDQAKGWQTKVEGGTAYIGEINIQGKSE